ncbi:MAG: type II toxin-antitoxin system PemK/MazF family toxin [Actinomycetota bacterium]|nr:type II toxin-antitoxin system PemK/MazF family toxin [Actinomycetota bacterium]
MWWHEAPEEKPRPYLVLSRDEVIPAVHRVLAVPATRTIRGIPSEVRLDEADGMPAECVLTLDNLRAVRQSYLVERICVLGPHRMREVCDALAFATACS